MEPLNDLMSLTAPGSGYLAFREEAELRFHRQPTICTMQNLALERDDIQQAPRETTVVFIQWSEVTKKMAVLGVRRIEEIQADQGQIPFPAALMDSAVRAEAAF